MLDPALRIVPEKRSMRHSLILAVLIFAFALPAAFAQVPAPAPVRDAEGQFVGVEPSDAGTDAPAAEDMAPGDADMMDAPIDAAVDNPAAIAAEQAAKAMDTEPQPVTLSAKLVDDGPIIPSGIAWRVFSAEDTGIGDIELIGRSDQATAVLMLPPGDYLVQAAYGYAQSTDTLSVTDTPQARVLVLDAGALRLNARVTGGQEIRNTMLKFQIFPQGLEDDPRSIIVNNVQPDEIVHLNAGVYHVVSTYGSVNARAETDIRVDQGQLTDATMFYDAAQVSFRLVSEIGGEAIADVDWTIKDANGETVYQYTGTFPSAILAAGDYIVLAQRGSTVHNRDFSVIPGPAHEIEVLTSL